jgi:hypothetical protein
MAFVIDFSLEDSNCGQEVLQKKWYSFFTGGFTNMIKKEINQYLEQKPENLQKTATKLMDIILSHPDLEADMRWGKPTFGFHGDFHHWICAIQVIKNKVALTLHFGGLLYDEKSRLIAGTSRFLRKLEYDNLGSIDEEEIKSFIKQAVEKLPYFKENWKELNLEWKNQDK